MALSLDDLFSLDPAAKDRAAAKIEEVLRAVNEDYPSRTQHETRMRIRLCVEHIRQCMAEFEWTLTRSLGTMKARLICHLNGADWAPDAGDVSIGR
jgi:hypothetical protein